MSHEAEPAGHYAAMYALNQSTHDRKTIETVAGEGVRYVLPQRIRPQEINETIDLFYRVTQKYKQSLVLIKSSGKVIHQMKRRALLPAEMEKITIPGEDLKQVIDY